MKILFISSWFPNKLEPTNGNFVQRHAEAVALKHHVDILHAIGDFNQKETYIFDDQIIHGNRTLIVYYKNSNNPIQNFIRRMKAYQLGYQKLDKPDLVHANILHTNLFFPIYLKKRLGIPFVVSEHWSAYQEINLHKLSFLKKIMIRTIANQASHVLPVTNNLIKGLKKLNIKTPMSTIGNVVDTELFQLKTASSTPFIFLHVSNLIALKQPKRIIEAAIQLRKTHQNFELYIGGDGDEEALIELIHKNKAEHYIKTFGIISLKSVAHKMQHADCFILFSQYENQPCVILESFSTGLPVIASQVGGIPEIMSNERGLLIDKDDDRALLSAMQNVLEGQLQFASPEVIRSYSVTNFSKEEIANQFTQLYNTIKS